MALKKIGKKSIPDEVFESLKEEIVSGNFEIGQKLPSEGKLCEQLGVGKYSIRTALQKLETIGLIEIKVGKGSYVTSHETTDELGQRLDNVLTANDIKEITEYRLATEMAIMNVAINKATDKDYHVLEDILHQMDQALLEGDAGLHAKFDNQFHSQICQMTHNEIFISTYEFISKKIRQHTIMLNTIYIKKNANQKAGEDLHWKIMKAMKEKDLKACYTHYVSMLSVADDM